jgi:hypothetical protein
LKVQVAAVMAMMVSAGKFLPYSAVLPSAEQIWSVTRFRSSLIHKLQVWFFPAYDCHVFLQQPQIILLKEGTDTSQGKAQLISNINACVAVVDAVRTTLGPRGMDKLIHDDKGTTTISNDGATIMRLLDIVHPAAKTLVDIARSQDSEVFIT